MAKSTVNESCTEGPVYNIINSVVPAFSFTVKSETDIPSPGPDPSLSIIVPTPESSIIATAGLEIFEILILISSVGSITLSSTIATETVWVDPLVVLSGKVTDVPFDITL